jgi:hypothetical protein
MIDDRTQANVQDLLRKRNLWIFPVTVFGRSSTNSTQRGYL